MAEQKQDYSGMTGGLDMSKLPIYGEDADERIKELRDAQQQALEALQHRYDQPNWWKVAAGFAKPQLGGFLASAGSAAEAMGENTELQRNQQLPIAQMKLQLAQSNMLLNAGKKVADQIKAWRDAHPGQTPSAQLVGEWEATAPNSNVVKSLKEELNFQQAQQTQNIQRAQVKQAANMPLTDADKIALGQLPEGQPRNPNEPVVTPLPKEEPIVAKPIGKEEPKGTVGIDDYITAHHNMEGTPAGQKSKTSSAVGPSGLIDSTRMYLQDKYHLPEYSTDPKVIEAYDHALIKDQQDTLSGAGLENSALNHRLTSWFGSSGGPKVINADPHAKIKDVISADAIKANGLNPDMSIGALRARVEGNLWDQGINPKYAVGEQAEMPKVETTPAATTVEITGNNGKQKYYPHSVPRPETAGEGTANREFALKKYDENASKVEAPYAEQIGNLQPIATGPNYTRVKNSYDTAINMIEQNPTLAKTVFAMMRQDPIQAALNEGFGMHAGALAANVSLPVQAFVDAGLGEKEKNYADKLFSNLMNITMAQLRGQGVSMGKVPQQEYMKALSGFVSPNQTAPAALNGLHHARAEFDQNKEFYDLVQKERRDKVDPTSATPYADIIANSPELQRLHKKYLLINKKYDEDYQKRLQAKNPPK